MQSIHFTEQEKVKINKAFKIFFERSSTKNSTMKGLRAFDIISILGFLVDCGYFVDCSFGSGNMANEPYIVFIRDDMPQITAKNGVYCRVCFERKTNKIKVNINTSYKDTYTFDAQSKINKYIIQTEKQGTFDYPNYKINELIKKIENDLNWFLAIPLCELENKL